MESTTGDERGTFEEVRVVPPGRASIITWVFAGVGVLAIVASVVSEPGSARSAASQVWPPFVLVAGLLLVGLAANQDGLFAAAGERLSRVAPTGPALVAGAALTTAVVTALLNLDTSVAFLTPVLVHVAREHHQSDGPTGTAPGAGTSTAQGGRLLVETESLLLVVSILLANAGSLLLPGSNLTNLIVLGQLHLTGSAFVEHMALPWLGAVVVTGGILTLAARIVMRGTGSQDRVARTPRMPRAQATRTTPATPATTGTTKRVPQTQAVMSAAAILAVIVLMLVLRNPALPVVAIGAVLTIVRLAQQNVEIGRVRAVLGLPILAGLFGVAVGLGTAGRVWSGPSVLLSHLDAAGTAAFAAIASVLVNNLPAASLLASRSPHHPFALLVGLNVGPNLFVTGSLAWFLWWKTSKETGSRPPVGRATRLGLVSVPFAIAVAIAALALTGPT